jgi:hypothetical protein
MDEKTAVATLSALAQGMRLRVFRALVLIYRQELTPMNALLGYLVAHCCGGELCGAMPTARCMADLSRPGSCACRTTSLRQPA